MLTRRGFLKASSLVALAPTVPAFLARTARAATSESDARILVVIQLEGGNDGINTVVPFTDEGYAKYRRVLRLPHDQLIKVNETVGLHPSLDSFGKLLDAGQLAIVQGVSYPNPSRSHFQSMAIWQSARVDPEEQGGVGWLGRALDQAKRPVGAVSSMFVGNGALPLALRGRRSIASTLERPEDLTLSSSVAANKLVVKHESKGDLAAFVERSMLDAYATADHLGKLARARDSANQYPTSKLGNHLQTVARLIKSGFGTRIYYTSQSGFDTHSVQLVTHRELLLELAAALKTFIDDMAAAKLGERIAVLVFSEFGRTVAENGSAGTDHGTAGPVFLAGTKVTPGIVGKCPSLLDLDPKHGDLKTVIDFRQVYASVLEDWLRLPAELTVGGSFGKQPFFRNA
jgi:uncharacterized protein (DUF1501 family)